ncbi:MAG: alpha-D-ribose 1-methylphosphonate 5-phosphate C-P-lyase PhnJ [Desulfitobacteriaceae bacterium]
MRIKYNFAFFDEGSKREIRRATLKAIAIPGYQVPFFASREMPIARGWGTGGLQLTLSLVGKEDILKVIDQGSDESVNAVNIKKLITTTTGITITDETNLAKLAKTKGIRLASHDDDTRDKIETLLECEGVVSEFPINLETAIYSKAKGIHVCVGAPNIVRGKSHSNNMRALDAITNNAADIVCSDYLPSAMLPALFHLTREGIKLTVKHRLRILDGLTPSVQYLTTQTDLRKRKKPIDRV